ARALSSPVELVAGRGARWRVTRRTHLRHRVLERRAAGPGRDERGARTLEIVERALRDRDALLVRLGVRHHELAHDADADALEARAVDPVLVGLRRNLPDARGGRRILGVVAGDRAQHGGGILDALAQDAGAIAGARGRK